MVQYPFGDVHFDVGIKRYLCAFSPFYLFMLSHIFVLLFFYSGSPYHFSIYLCSLFLL